MVRKTYSDCYLYNKYPIYNKILFEAMMDKNFIDKGVDSFKDIVYEIKRTRTNDHILSVLTSPKTVLLLPEKPLPKPFVVFVAKDPRSKDKELKLFIDCTNAIKKDNTGNYRVNDTRLLSYLVSGFYNMKYAVMGIDALKTGQVRELGAICFSNLYTYLIDYLAKISVVDGAKDKCIYLSSRYFLEGICQLDAGRSREVSRSISGITEIKENTYNYVIKDQDSFTDLKKFINVTKDAFKIEKLSVDLIVEKWMYIFGPGTVFSLEYLPAFITMMTDAYVGSFINNQKTIEKICGKSMVEFGKLMINYI